ncbi:hypothetical protein F4778DRAFT_204822 [Xylariomycetidae sp. FL2044]|nr:hypothetical protein F4778DRAFT_204822 [Xylariomycetidae sp. FL2044]
MEALQLAQMLADLNDLQAAQDQTASKNLVSANKTLDRKEHTPLHLAPKSVADDRASSNSTPGGRMTEKFGRRMFSPPLTRNNSGTTPSSVPGTPRREESHEPDIDRASTLLSLYEIRAKLKEQDNSSLMKAREKINALAAKQRAQEAGEQMNPTVSQQPHHHRRKTSGRISFPKQS